MTSGDTFKERGQSLVELLVGVAIVTIIIGSVVTAVVLVLRIHFQSVASRGAAALEQEMMESVRSVAEGKWTNLYNVSPKGATTTYRIAASGTPPVLTVASGTEEVVVNNITYTRFFSVENVNRDINGNIVATGGFAEDPSTQKVTVTVRWPISGQTAELKIAEYLTRSRSEVFRFTDWSGGVGVTGGVPPEQIDCWSTPPAGRTIVRFQDSSANSRSIVSNESAAQAQIGPTSTSLLAGEYYVTLVSYDPHTEHVPPQTQYNEQWYVLLEASDGTDVATTRGISDLPDSFDNLQEVVRSNLILNSDVTQATAIHAVYPSSETNSIRPVCAAFDRLSSPPKRQPSSLPWNNYAGIEDVSASSTAGELSLVTGQLDGWLDSSTYDTGVPGGAAFNSIMWLGELGSGGTTVVKFRLATANCLDGQSDPPGCTQGGWDIPTSGDGAYLGPDGTEVTYYQPSGPGVPVTISSIYHKNKRFFRYTISLERSSGATSPVVRDVIINWSP